MTPNVYHAVNEEELWQQIKKDLSPDDLFYSAVINYRHHRITLDIDIDLGGGFESGYATTDFRTLLKQCDFHFNVYKQGVVAEVGKLLGMEDIIVGDEVFDKNFVVKANNKELVKQLFEIATIKETLIEMASATIGNVKLKSTTEEAGLQLHLSVEEGITDIITLKKLYKSFTQTIDFVESKAN